MPSYKVHYFNARGRAEIIRLVLAYAKQPFEDERLAGETWQAFKPNTPFGQMPCISIDGTVYAQTGAIIQYLARELGLYGKSNLDALAIDQVVCLVGDFLTATIKTMMEKDEAKKAELQKNFGEVECPKYLGHLENLLKKNGNDYFVGSGVTLADLSVYDYIWGLNSRMPGVLDKFPLVKAHQQRIGDIPQIKDHVEKRPTTDF